MEIVYWGTRGSVPVASDNQNKYGGRSTCYEVVSDCIPHGMRIAVDAGTGFMPFGDKALASGLNKVAIFFTHYHHDHTQGLFLSPVLHIKSIPINLYGPIDHGVDPITMMKDMMKPPYFPVDFTLVASHVSGKGIEHPQCVVFIVHSIGGLKMFKIDELENLEKRDNPQVTLGDNKKYDLNSCLVIKMYKCDHPEITISYRFEERPTGKVFVFLTDHENQDGFPQNFIKHLKGTDLLVIDCQYSREEYDEKTAGFGHGTPDYCVRLAKVVGAKSMGFTHHSPSHDDGAVDGILDSAVLHAVEVGYEGTIFSCRDGGSTTV